MSMASLLCIPSSLTLTITKPSSRLQLQQKPISMVSSSVRAHKSEFPLFSPTRQFSPRTLTTPTKAAPSTPVTPADPEQTVEHIVLFIMKDPAKEDPKPKKTKKEIEETLIKALNCLRTLPGVLYLTAGYLSKIQPATAEFNIFLHSRHATKEDLSRFMKHDLKYAFTMTYTERDYKDYMIVDYVYERNGSLANPKLNNVLRCTFLNMKDGWGEIQRYRVVQAVSDAFKGADQLTFGKTYLTPLTYIPEGQPPPPPANKGYDLATLSVFPTMEKVNALGTPEQFAQKLSNQLKGDLDERASVMVIDYEIKQIYDGNRENLWV